MDFLSYGLRWPGPSGLLAELIKASIWDVWGCVSAHDLSKLHISTIMLPLVVQYAGLGYVICHPPENQIFRDIPAYYSGINHIRKPWNCIAYDEERESYFESYCVRATTSKHKCKAEPPMTYMSEKPEIENPPISFRSVVSKHYFFLVGLS